MPSKSKKHHYLPKFYMRNFADNDGKIFILSLKEYTRRVEEDKSFDFREIIRELNAYTHDLDGICSKKNDNSSPLPYNIGFTDNLEQTYSEIDSNCYNLLRRLIKGGVLDDGNKILLLFFFNTLIFRHPAIRESKISNSLTYNTVSIDFEGIDSYYKEKLNYWHLQSGEYDRVNRFILPAKKLADHPENIKVEYMELLRLDNKAKEQFICSDNPVIIWRFDAVETILKDFFVPISPKALLVNFANFRYDYGNFSNEEICKSFNLLTIGNAQEYLFASTRETLEFYFSIYTKNQKWTKSKTI